MINEYDEYTNYKKKGAGNDIYGKQRLELAIYLKNKILPKINNKWFIENGTLLGAYRNNKFIDHDDDFDYAICIDDIKNTELIFNKINKLLNNKYKCRLISSYALKIEIYDDTYGKYLLSKKYKGSDYHYVNIDLQFYLKINNNEYKLLYYINPFDFIIHKKYLFPLSKIKLENNIFPCPNDILYYLIQKYGNIKYGAKYDNKTGKYI